MVTGARDGSTFRIGTDAEVAWIAEGTSASRTIIAAIPPVFEAYATVMLPPCGEGQDEHDRAVLALRASSRRGSRGGWDTWTPAPMTSSSPMRRR